ncbi:MAG: KpsF/GutQ family sugar-phosphate isomerase [candidate division Zixibacteria bacterium]
MKPSDYGKEAIRSEAEAIAALVDRLDERFDSVVEAILDCHGRLIVSGMGKSGLIGKKMVATFNSTGISSFFLHPAEALHGDLGLMRPDDLLMLISKSGQLDEADTILSAARRLGIRVIGLCGTVDSDLFKRADFSLDCSVDQEACPNNLVPTSSSTAALVMGDALAVALLQARNFTPSDFAVLHPGGFLGRRLLKRVSELHHTGDALPVIDSNSTLPELLVLMTAKRLGCVVTLQPDGKLDGIFTDGDLRRQMEERDDLYSCKASDVMRKAGKSINQEALIEAALAIMEKFSITQLPTLDADDKVVGLIHLHDILRSKLI